MSPKCKTCPIDGECRSYPFLCGKVAESPDRYRKILDQVNQTEDQSSPEDRALRAYVQAHPCGPCP